MTAGLVVMSLHHVVVPFVTSARRPPAPVVLFVKATVRPPPCGVTSVGVPLAVWPTLKPMPAYEYFVPLTAARVPVTLSVLVVQAAAIGTGITAVPKAS